MTMPSPLKVIVRFLAFMFGAAGIFAMGCVGAGILWSVTYHRYDMPESGAYYSSVDGRFDSIGTDPLGLWAPIPTVGKLYTSPSDRPHLAVKG